MKHVANSCTIVAALIATVVFSIVSNVPGGTSDNTGELNFLKEIAFLFFAIADVFFYRAAEHIHILRHHADMVSETL